jgi:hypothetical protein
MVTYQTLVEGRDADGRADLDAAIEGRPLPSFLRAEAERDAHNRAAVAAMAADGWVEVG